VVRLRSAAHRLLRPPARPAPVVLCVDIEPDDRELTRGTEPTVEGFLRFLEELECFRRALTQPGGAEARVSWFLRMDPEVAVSCGSAGWVAKAHGRTLRDLERSGDDLGLHTHDRRWDAEAGAWVADHEDAAWGVECTRTARAAFRDGFGRDCRLHRGGDRFVSEAMLDDLAEGGVEVDLTVEPGMAPAGALGPGELSRGTTADYRRAPTRPYWPADDDLVVARPAGERGRRPLMVPLLSYPLAEGRDMVRPWDPASQFIRAFDLALTERPPIIALAVRSDITVEYWDDFVASMRYVAARGHPFVTVTRGVEMLRRSGRL
jgi:hypothetical protein